MKIIDTIEGEPIMFDGVKVEYTCKAAIDTDGIGDLHGDPCAQGQTSLKKNGKSLNADVDCYIVVPPAIIKGVPGIVLGCMAIVTNMRTGTSVHAVVGDVGPHNKLGEISRATAKALGINPSPTSGGEDRHVIHYQIWPGVPAKGYALQAS